MLQLFLLTALAIIKAVGADPLLFTFGCLRMGSTDVESSGALAGYLSAVQYANTYNTVPGVQFRLNVTTIPCRNYTDCRAVNPHTDPFIQGFLAAMPGYSAVFRPNFLLAETVVDEATRLGGTPVLDPDDIRMASFTNGSDHIINFNHNWQRQLDHIFTYMIQTGRCAKSGIVHGVITPDYTVHINSMKKLFTDGGYPKPPSADLTNLTDAQFLSFVSEPNRNCFVVIGSNYFIKNLTARMVRLNFDTSSISLFGVSSVAGDSWVMNGTSTMFSTLHLVHWTPLYDTTTLTKAFFEWLPNIAAYAHMFGAAETIPTKVLPFSTQGWLVMNLMIETVRGALSRVAVANTTGPLPLAWSKLVAEFYMEARQLEGYRFNALVRTCPRAPAKQICYCNALTRASFMRAVNGSTGVSYTIFDDVSKGQRNIASIEFPDSCGYYASAWSYPITGLALYPSILMGTGQRTAAEEAYEIYQATYAGVTYNINYAATAPTRALRYAAYDVKSTESISSAVDKYIDSLKPFVIYGSMVETITNPRGILTLAASMTASQLEEPDLVPHSQWRWDIVKLQPVLADYIHGLVAFTKSRTYTSFHAIATTKREAELISMSFATFGYLLPVETIPVTADVNDWANFATTWLTSGTNNPFILAVSGNNNNSVVQSITSTAAAIGRGMLAVAAPLAHLANSKDILTFNANNQGDIIFGSFRKEWWKADTVAAVTPSLKNYSLSPRYHQAMLSLDVAKQLYTQVYYDYTKTAAEILYQTSVVSASETSFGPFSNESCTDAEIAANTRDRNCQCTKGVRRIFILSMRNYKAGSSSSRTGGYSWTMTTCGVVYSPYVYPTSASNSSGLSSGAIAGIAVGASLGLLLLIGVFVANALFSGRNNRAAPKDGSQPFAIVFTDIQSSTALWARAPAAMSEAVDQHHHLMRKSLRRNWGYEVKTVGDSFMVAFKDPANAASFALDIQVMLHGADWSEELDATYLELIAEAEVAVATTAVDDASTQSESPLGNQNAVKLLDTISNSHSAHHSHASKTYSDANQMAFHHRSKQPSLYSSESPHASESPRGPGEHHMLSMIVTHSRTPNVSAHLSKPPAATSSKPAASRNEASGTQYSDDEELFGAAGPWHGLRVRIGVHYGMGDIRKDPVSQGYDYYGTVVNTAARVEGVGHGGQTLLTDVVFDALPSGFAKSNDAVIIALGPQPLRGLDAPIALYQMVPAALQSRRFPALRLHIEKESDESSVTDTTTGTTTSETPEVLVSRICGSKQFANVAPEEIMDRYNYFLATFGPSTDKYKSSVITKIGESWGFEKTAKVVNAGGVGRTRLLVSLIAKVTKAYHSAQRNPNAKRNRTVTHTSLSHNPETMSASEAIKSIYQADMNSVSDGR